MGADGDDDDDDDDDGDDQGNPSLPSFISHGTSTQPEEMEEKNRRLGVRGRFVIFEVLLW